ncbi:MAG: hypothetical protein COB36_08015 [Alphaproteobacteria bacterium]|nr:MAG: hypothetical protein COB36_08015 [Alphaproteobacteria bacterium]
MCFILSLLRFVGLSFVVLSYTYSSYFKQGYSSNIVHFYRRRLTPYDKLVMPKGSSQGFLRMAENK